MKYGLKLEGTRISGVIENAKENLISPTTYCVVKNALDDGFTIFLGDTKILSYENFIYSKNHESVKNSIYLKNDESVKTSIYLENSVFTLYLANIYESDSKTFVTGTSTKQSNEIFETSIYVYCTKEVYEYLNANAADTQLQKFTFDKSKEAIVKISDIEVVNEELEKDEVKINIINDARFMIQQRFDTSIIFDFFTFIMKNNELAAEGFFITNENRDDKYLEIVNKNDEDLLNNLSDYLKAMDNLLRYQQYYNLFKSLSDRLDSDELSVEEMQEAFESFKKEFN